MQINKDMYDQYKKSFNSYIHKYEDGSECTFFYKIIEKNTKSVIWVHGFNDYFYQFHISDFFLKKGYNFYSIFLRNYRNNENLFYTNDLKEYITDIEMLLNYISDNSKSEKTLLYGHSMGGLISSIFCYESVLKKKISGLVLNSPFFNFNEGLVTNIFLSYLIYYLGIIYPKLAIRYPDDKQKNLYSIEIYKRFYFESNYKLLYIPAIYAGWVTTIIYYQTIIQKNFLDLAIPIIVFHSDKSVYNQEGSGDSVLNIEDIKKISKNLGSKIEIHEIDNAIHDIFCSPKNPLKNALKKLEIWLDKLPN